jgi:hypothetical protein
MHPCSTGVAGCLNTQVKGPMLLQLLGVGAYGVATYLQQQEQHHLEQA